MGKTINIRCKNTGKTHKVPIGFTLEEVYEMLEINLPLGVTSAKVNNKVEGLHFMFFNDKDVEFLDISSSSGMRTYTRSLFFVLYKAVRDLYPKAHLRIDTPVSNGYYCTLEEPCTEKDEMTVSANGTCTTHWGEKRVTAIKQRMDEIVRADLPFHRITCPTEEAVALFQRNGLCNKAKLLESKGELYTTYYTLDDTADYFYGSLLIRTGQLTLFDAIPYGEGLLLRLPDPEHPGQLRPMRDQPKMFDVFREQHRWQKILGVSTIGELNQACANGSTYDLINVSEALQEKKISRLADRIAANPDLKVILIAGPSSSGKTTFSKRLSVQLMACGLRPVPISLDDYFVSRNETPLLPNGDYDYENVEAMNIPLFNAQINSLLKGEEVELPRYNFQTGESEQSGKHLQLKKGMLLILEGIHALNPVLTASIPAENKFKIYASALTTILLDDHNYIPTTDNRLLRRIVRDYKYRGYSAEETIRRWPMVREGEEKWIFPYQEQADEMINTALLFELAALRVQALPLLEQVPESVPEYSEAYRLRKFLDYLCPISLDGLPPTSLLREFMGGSTFQY
ncbi:phosphoribulokinase/uridine kinase family protein [gut metagenome]|uniref:Phosphoribulokinase/uridine kinase family protein n=1 Tax=gut metagenome TaxID=749906 RepID=J9GLK0_9ZZZZ